MKGMNLRARYSTATILLAMALVVVCFGWAADRAWLQRQRRMMEQERDIFQKGQAELQFALKVNRELRFEVAKLKGLPPPVR
jgi:hypothetical protein